MIVEREGKVYQQPRCPRHENGESLIFSDAALYRKLDAWNDLMFPGERGCECGEGSVNGPTLAVIDITNRCNLHCPVCFAETNGHGRHYFLERERIRPMLEALIERNPVPCRHVQFSGGEPTLHPEFPAILKMAREMGFTHIQVATNGSRFSDPDYVAVCEEAGLHTLYLQFDGMNDEVYLKLRGRRLLEQKLGVVENVARTNMRIVFVPTIASGINVDQIGPIFDYAVRYSRHVTGISIQPAARIGRVEIDGREQEPFNLAVMASEFSRQTGLTRFPDDWFPLAAISMITRAVSRLRGEALPEPACDAHCSLGAYFYVDSKNQPTCVTRFFDLERFLHIAATLSVNGAGPAWKKPISRLKELAQLADCLDSRRAPQGVTFQRLLRGLDGWENKSFGRGPRWDQQGFNGMFVAGMHFMDARNYNLRRLRRCIIQYVTTNREVIPFCSYNAGVRHRTAEEAARQERAL